MQLDWVAIAFRWMHILAAITAVGGTIFMRAALAPSVAILPDDQRKALHEQVRSRWVKFVMGAILFLIISGLYNFMRRLNAPGIERPYIPLYHGLFTLKVLLALIIFFVASALTGRAAALARFRQNAKFWLSVNVVLAVIVVLISGVLRFIPPKAAIPLSRISQAGSPLVARRVSEGSSVLKLSRSLLVARRVSEGNIRHPLPYASGHSPTAQPMALEVALHG